MSLGGTLRSWARRYGPEAAFVGRVAVAAFLPPGLNKLVESGLEAAFEYIQSQSERPVDESTEVELQAHLARAGLHEEQLQQLGTLVTRVESEGSRVLSEARDASRSGQSYDQAEQRLRALISSDPTLSAMRASLAEITTTLSRLTEQGEVLIAGQAYQTEAIEEMMRMIHAIAHQVGASVHGHKKSNLKNHQSFQDFGSSAATPPLSPSAFPSASLLSSSLTPSSSLTANSSHSPSLLSSSLTSTTSHQPSLLSSSLSNSSSTSSTTLKSPLLDPATSSISLGSPLSSVSVDTQRIPSALEQLSPSFTPSSSAQSLIDRFYKMQGKSIAPPEGSVDLVARFQKLIKPNEQGGEDLMVGEGRVALMLTSVGSQPIAIVKWICEAWGFTLADAIIATQSVPVVLKRSNDFVALAQAQRDLSALGASLKLSS